MLEPQATYVERRLTLLQVKNQRAAKADLRIALQNAGTMRFDDAWARAMQFSLVTEADFKEWINELKNNGSLAGTPKRGEVLKWLK